MIMRRIIPLKGKRHEHTHKEIEAAIRKFQKAGGLIKKLPAEKVLTNNVIYQKYESNLPDYDSVGVDLY